MVKSSTDPSSLTNARQTSVGQAQYDERSPLVEARAGTENSGVAETDGSISFDIPTRSTIFLMLLTLSIGGLQITWAVELSNGSPYLLSLGITKYLMALVWFAGPLTGVLVQPYVGIRSDQSRIPWGKRRPFMIGGGIATVISLLALAWVREIVEGIASATGGDPKSHVSQVMIIIIAVLFIYVLDFAINVVQASIRAFIVDNAPPHQQDLANAWASRMSGIGNVLGYICGYTNLPNLFPFLGNTQFQVLCSIACIALTLTLAISCTFVKERDPREEGPPDKSKQGIWKFFSSIFRSIQKLPPQIYKVCETQFWAWIGWFPFLFYITTYIGEIYVEPYYTKNPNMSKKEEDALWEEATRQGALALLVWAIVTLSANLLLPFIVAPTFTKRPIEPSPGIFTKLLDKLVIRSLTLRRTWILSQLLFGICMFCTFFVRSISFATVLVAICGISWAVSLWAPFAIISSEVSKRDAARRNLILNGDSTAPHPPQHDQAGVILGIHNVAVSAPQMIATIGSSIIFKFLQKERGAQNDTSVGWALRIGGIAAVIAAWRATKLQEETGQITDDEEEEDLLLPNEA
jgi:solute carrier family 45 protein 1/2/4